MTKSPEEYFKEQDFSASGGGASGFTPAEQAFMDKYLGVETGAVLEKIGISPAAAPVQAEPDQHEEMAAERSLDDMLREAPELLMVGFFIGGQEFTLPTVAVQEVIRHMPVAKLPAAPRFVAGVINLRGRVTPLIHLRDVLEVSSAREDEDKFIIVCRRRGFQVGMIIEKVHTMYRVPQADIDWALESHIGANVDFISGLLKLQDKLVGIVSVDRVTASILK
jgi:purine-binding chemotaxis protein CheW